MRSSLRTAPLLQTWYARSGGPSANDPYFLYGASNAGSLLALLAFPLLAEPFLGAGEISNLWFAGFVLFGALLVASGALALSGTRSVRTQTTEKVQSETRPEAKHIATWIFVAFIPSSLMLSMTTKVTTDLGSIPLIWVIPLAIYIFTFVLAFSKWRRLRLADLRVPTLMALAVGAVLLSGLGSKHPTPAIILVYIFVIFMVSLFAHRLLYDLRPSAGQLTVFYIALSVGGACGGLFNSIIAPSAFSQEFEAPVTLMLVGGIFLLRSATFTARDLGYGFSGRHSRTFRSRNSWRAICFLTADC